VQQQNRRSATTDADILGAASNGHLLVVKSGGPRLDGSGHYFISNHCGVSIVYFAVASKADGIPINDVKFSEGLWLCPRSA
jgi:hypothetical protein